MSTRANFVLKRADLCRFDQIWPKSDQNWPKSPILTKIWLKLTKICQIWPKSANFDQNDQNLTKIDQNLLFFLILTKIFPFSDQNLKTTAWKYKRDGVVINILRKIRILFFCKGLNERSEWPFIKDVHEFYVKYL